MKRKMHYNEAQNIKLARQLIAKEMHGEAADEEEEEDCEEDCEENEEEDEDNEDEMQDECKTGTESGEPWDARGKSFLLGWLGWSPFLPAAAAALEPRTRCPDSVQCGKASWFVPLQVLEALV